MIRVIKSNTDTAAVHMQEQDRQRRIHDEIAISMAETKERAQKHYPIGGKQKLMTVNAFSMDELVTSCIETISAIDCSSQERAKIDVETLLRQWRKEKLSIPPTSPDALFQYFIQKMTDEVRSMFEQRMAQGKPVIALDSEWKQILTQPHIKTLLTQLISMIL